MTAYVTTEHEEEWMLERFIRAATRSTYVQRKLAITCGIDAYNHEQQANIRWRKAPSPIYLANCKRPL